jgi:hypothetical protein
MLRGLGFDRVLILSAVAGSAVLAGFAWIGPATPEWVMALYITAFGLVRSVQFMSSNTLSYADMPAEQLSRATSLGGVMQQLTVSLGVAIGAMLLEVTSDASGELTVANFHHAFLLIAIIPLASLPGFFFLRPEDGAEVSGHVRRKARG